MELAAAPAASPAAEEKVTRLLRDFSDMEQARGIWNGHWEEVANKVLPHYSTSFYSQGNITPGVKRGQEMFDATASAALWKFASFMEAMLTPASELWHMLRAVDPILQRNRAARAYYEQVRDLLFHYRYSPHSGYQANQHEGYVSIGGFGTSCLFTDAFRDPTMPGVGGLRYRNIPLGEAYFAVNHQGQVDKVFRRFRMTLRQIEQRWPGKLPDGLKSRLESKPEDMVFILHCVEPNGEFQAGRIDRYGKRFASTYVLKDQKVVLEENGYRCMPYSVGRYIMAPGEIYGRSPAMNVLPSINMLNEEKKIVIKQGHRAVDPVILAHDDGIVDSVSLRPGAVIPGGMNSDGRPLLGTLPTGDARIGKELMDDERLAINDAFLVTLFQILVERPEMTATEVLERAKEKAALISPTMGRQQSESLGPQIERELDVLSVQGLLPPPPQIVIDAGAEYKVEYDAPLNRMMRAAQAAGTMRTIQYTAEIVAQTQDPSPLDHFNWDVIVPELAEISGMPIRYMNDEETVAQKRQGREADKTVAQVTQALPGMASMLKSAAPRGTSPTQGQDYGARP